MSRIFSRAWRRAFRFRLRPPGLGDAEMDALNAAARARIVGSGRFDIVQTVLRGRTWLRTALMNPFTEPSHLDAVVSAGRETLSS